MSKEEQEKYSYFVRAKKDKEHPYVMISKSMFRDPNLSLKGKGLLGYLLTLPDDWKVNPKQIANALNIGYDQMYSTLNELISKGYCNRIQLKENFQYSNMEYQFAEEPIFLNPKIPRPENPDTETQVAEMANITNTDSKLKTETTTQDLGFEELFSLFDGLGLEPEEIQSLVKFSVERLKLASAFVKDPAYKPTESVLATIRWHCNPKIKAPVHSKKSQTGNICKEIKDKLLKRYGTNHFTFNFISVDVGNEEIVFDNGAAPKAISYILDDFWKKLQECEIFFKIKLPKETK